MAAESQVHLAIRARAFASTYAAQFGRLYAYLRFHTGDAACAEDLTAAIFARAWARRRSPRAAETAVTWLFSTARSLAIGHDTHGQQDGPRGARCLAEHPPLRDLDDRAREIVGLRFVAGLHNREIAPILGLDERTVANTLRRALRNTGDHQEREGGERRRRLFARGRSADDRRFDENLERVLAGWAPDRIAAADDVEREEFAAARQLHQDLAPLRDPPLAVCERVWQVVRAQMPTEPRTRTAPPGMFPVPAPPIARQRHRHALRLGLIGVLAGVVALLVLLAAPVFLRYRDVNRFLATVAAAPLAVPPGQVLHCTLTQWHAPAGQPAEVLVAKDVWLDPQGQRARIEFRLPRQFPSEHATTSRQVFDGRTLSWSTTYLFADGRSEEYAGQEGGTYAMLERSHFCSAADQVAALKQELSQLEPARQVTTSEEVLDDVPVIVLSFPMDARASSTYNEGLPAEPGRSFENLPARYTFTRDRGQLIRTQAWVMTSPTSDSQAGKVAPVEYRWTYALAPADRYSSAFFSAEPAVKP